MIFFFIINDLLIIYSLTLTVKHENARKKNSGDQPLKQRDDLMN